jgi:hypothetical protein
MATMFVRHTISDYEAWRKAYDDFAPLQKAKGVTAQAVYQAANNPNDITVTHEFGSIEAAQAFANSDELKKAMQGAGVVGAPTIWFTNKV